jgi:hypothetical protein
MSFATYDLPREKIGDVGTNFDDFANELMANHHRDGNGLLRPIIPAVDMQIGAADGGAPDTYQDVIDPDRRNRDVLQPQSGLGVLLDESFQGFS